MTTTKPVMEQKDKYNQKLTLHLDLENGEQAKPEAYLKGLLKTQSLEQWNGRPDEFEQWIAVTMADYWKRVKVSIWGHSRDKAV